MTIQIPGGYSQATVNYSGAVFDSGRACSVFGIHAEPDDITNGAQAIKDYWEATILPEVNSEVTLENVTLVTDARIGVSASGMAGGRSGDMSPPNCCPLIKLGTGLRGREHRGRMYPPGLLNDGDVADTGAITSSRRLAIEEAFGTVFASIGTDAILGPIVILHNSDSDPDQVLSGIVESQIATQRRRLR